MNLGVALYIHSFFKNSSLDETSICSPAFLSRINMRLHSIPVSLALVKKVIIKLDSWLYISGVSEELWTWTFIRFISLQWLRSWKVLGFEKSPELLINLKECPGIDHLLYFSRYFSMIGFQNVYNNVSIVIYISEKNLN